MQTNFQFITLKYKTELYQEMVQLRFLVLRKPLGLNYSQQDLVKDESYDLFALKDMHTGVLVACCCLENLHPIYRLRQMAVHPEFQKKSIGSLLIEYIENWVTARNGRQITMHARSYAIPFYEKNAYRSEGEEFLEVGIPHRVMSKNL